MAHIEMMECGCGTPIYMYVTCTHTANEYGLFKPDEDPTKGRWLDLGRTLEYYHLKSGVS